MNRHVLITGGAGFIAGNLTHHWCAAHPQDRVVVLDALTYAGNRATIEPLIEADRIRFVQGDICDRPLVERVLAEEGITHVAHLAAESHVDRSIEGPGADGSPSSPDCVNITSNVSGTFHLLQAVRSHWEQLGAERQAGFRFHHISTDEVFGSLGPEGRFSETTPYDPRSPYSASKAASDHLVNAWHHTYGLPVVLTNCSNNYGPWQFPEKLIPVVILKAAAGEPIPLYGDGGNVRDWLYVEDHVDALLLAATQGQVGRSYCVGGHGERTNKDVVHSICALLDELQPNAGPHARLITPVSDRPGHDRRYAIDPSRISTELGWQPRHSFADGLAATVRWYLANQPWCQQVRSQAGYGGGRLGVLAGINAMG